MQASDSHLSKELHASTYQRHPLSFTGSFPVGGTNPSSHGSGPLGRTSSHLGVSIALIRSLALTTLMRYFLASSPCFDWISCEEIIFFIFDNAFKLVKKLDQWLMIIFTEGQLTRKKFNISGHRRC